MATFWIAAVTATASAMSDLQLTGGEKALQGRGGEQIREECGAKVSSDANQTRNLLRRINNIQVRRK